jgi:hypothetical protein
MKRLPIFFVVLIGLIINIGFVQAQENQGTAYRHEIKKMKKEEPIQPVKITGTQLNYEMRVFIHGLTGKWVITAVSFSQSGQTDEMGNSYIGKIGQFEAGITGLTLEQKKLITDKLLSYGLGNYFKVIDILESDRMWFGAGVRWELHEELLPKTIH